MRLVNKKTSGLRKEARMTPPIESSTLCVVG